MKNKLPVVYVGDVEKDISLQRACHVKKNLNGTTL